MYGDLFLGVGEITSVSWVILSPGRGDEDTRIYTCQVVNEPDTKNHLVQPFHTLAELLLMDNRGA
jgi:hypothetical protein